MSSTSYQSSADAGAGAGPASGRTVEAPAKSRDELYSLPRTPVITIRASKSWLPLKLHYLWTYRELLYFLMWRDIKVRYKQTLLGAMWSIIQPLVMMIIFTFFFSKLARIPTEGIPSAPFYYAGLCLWTFFSNAVMNGANSLIGNTNLITKVYFPRLIIPSAAVGAGLIDFAIASILFVPLLFYYGLGMTWRLLLILPLSVLITTLALGMGVLFSALNTKYRDVRYVLPFLLQVWFFISPVIYPSSLVPREWRWVLVLNPMTGIIESYRASLFGQPVNWWALAYSMVFTLILLSSSAYTFRRIERRYAEVI